VHLGSVNTALDRNADAYNHDHLAEEVHILHYRAHVPRVGVVRREHLHNDLLDDAVEKALADTREEDPQRGKGIEHVLTLMAGDNAAVLFRELGVVGL
jgi:hypothetical protein